MSAAAAKYGWRVVGGLSAAAAALAARKALDLLWRQTTGKTPPANPESPTTTVAEAVGWAVVSGVAMGVARVIAMRQAAHVWRRASGTLPPGLEEVD